MAKKYHIFPYLKKIKCECASEFKLYLSLVMYKSRIQIPFVNQVSFLLRSKGMSLCEPSLYEDSHLQHIQNKTIIMVSF